MGTSNLLVCWFGLFENVLEITTPVPFKVSAFVKEHWLPHADEDLEVCRRRLSEYGDIAFGTLSARSFAAPVFSDAKFRKKLVLKIHACKI